MRNVFLFFSPCFSTSLMLCQGLCMYAAYIFLYSYLDSCHRCRGQSIDAPILFKIQVLHAMGTRRSFLRGTDGRARRWRGRGCKVESSQAETGSSVTNTAHLIRNTPVQITELEQAIRHAFPVSHLQVEDRSSGCGKYSGIQ